MIRWRGHVAWDDERWGFYPLTRDGKRYRRLAIRLIAVTRRDGSHFYRIAMPWQKAPPPGRIVELDFVGHSKGDITA